MSRLDGDAVCAQRLRFVRHSLLCPGLMWEAQHLASEEEEEVKRSTNDIVDKGMKSCIIPLWSIRHIAPQYIVVIRKPFVQGSIDARVFQAVRGHSPSSDSTVVQGMEVIRHVSQQFQHK